MLIEFVLMCDIAKQVSSVDTGLRYCVILLSRFLLLIHVYVIV